MTGRWSLPTSIALGLALLLSVGLLVAALFVPVYGTESASAVPEGITAVPEVTGSTGTLVSVNGLGALLVVAVPLIVTLLVALLLQRPVGTTALIVAVLLTALYLGFCVLAILSIGILLLPFGLVLLVACACARIGPVPSPVGDPA